MCVVGSLIWRSITQVHPDYQIAYAASVPLSEDENALWEAKLSALGLDCNGDGKVVIQVNQYIFSQEDAMYTAANNVKLMADLDSCESYFFLLKDPEAFQESYEVLQEDWFPVENGLYLARRTFYEDRVSKNVEDCDALWKRLLKEAG